MKLITILWLLALSFGCLVSCKQNLVLVPDSPYAVSNDAFTTKTIASGFTIPYGIAIVGENEYFITDRVGKMFHFEDSTLTEISGVPEVVTFGTPGIPAIMHGGLMDVSLHPDYPTNSWIYISYLASDGFAKVSRLKVQDDTIS